MNKDALIIAISAFMFGFVGGYIIGGGKGKNTFNHPIRQSVSVPQKVNDQNEKIKEIKKRLEARLKELQQLEKEGKLTADNKREMGNIHFDFGNLKMARKYYEEYLKEKPEDAKVITDLGIVYRRLGDPDRAIELFDRAIKADPQLFQPRFNKGVVLLHEKGDKEAAYRTWKKMADEVKDIPHRKEFMDRLNELEKMIESEKKDNHKVKEKKADEQKKSNSRH